MKCTLLFSIILSLNTAYAAIDCRNLVDPKFAIELAKTTTMLENTSRESKSEVNKAQQAATINVANLAIKIQQLETLLSPDSKNARQALDPRWLGKFGLRRDTTNPYTIALQGNLAQAVALKKSITDVLNEVVDLNKINKLDISSLKIDDQIVLGWLLKKLSTLLTDLVAETDRDKRDSNKTNDIIKTVTKLNKEFNEFFEAANSGRINPLLSTARMSQQDEMVTSARKSMKQVIGRDVQNSFAERLEQRSRQTNMDSKVLFNLFQKVDQAGEALPNRKGINDVYVTTLAIFAFESRLKTNEIMAYFKQVDDLGGTYRKDFTIEDAAVTLLTVEGLKKNISASNMVESFYKVVEHWKKTAEKYTFVDEDLAEMALIAQQLGIPESKVFDRYIEIEKAGKQIRSSYHINDFAAVELTRLSFLNKITTAEIVARYTHTLTSLEKYNKSWANSDHAVVRILSLAFEIGVSYDRVLDLASTISSLSKDLNNVKTVIAFAEMALQSKFNAGVDFNPSGSLLSDAEINYTQLFMLDRRLILEREWVSLGAARLRASRQRGSSSSSRNSNAYDGSSSIIDPLQYAITGSITNFDNNPFTPF